MADGAVGRSAMINHDDGHIATFLDQDVRRARYPDIQAPTASAVTITGQATRVSSGYRVSGRFPFARGSRHSDWIWLGRAVVDDRMQQFDRNGVLETRHCLLRLSDCEILDTWFTVGVRGTDINDLRVDDVYVATERTSSFQDPALIKKSGPLYAFPFMFITKGAAPASEVSRHAIDMLIDSVARKPARRYTLGVRGDNQGGWQSKGILLLTPYTRTATPGSCSYDLLRSVSGARSRGCRWPIWRPARCWRSSNIWRRTGRCRLVPATVGSPPCIASLPSSPIAIRWQ